MSGKERREFEEKFRQSLWAHSSDDVKRHHMKAVRDGHLDADGLPRNIRRAAFWGGVFGKLIGWAIVLGALYLIAGFLF